MTDHAREAVKKYVKTVWKGGTRPLDTLKNYCEQDFLAGYARGQADMLAALRGEDAKAHDACHRWSNEWADWLEKRFSGGGK